MTVQLTTKSFREVLTLSRLVPAETIDRLCKEFPHETSAADDFAELLVRQNLVTEWQASKLLQAKHRGFFLGAFKLRALLAKGGMSTIFVAEEVATSQMCALKVLPLSRAAEASYLPRFLREADIASRLEHPNIVRVFGLHEASDGKANVYFMAMELLQGADLAAEVTRRGPLSIRDVADAIRQSAVGLHYAHEAGLVHRDIKPGNLFREDDGTIRILDLGLASMLEGEQENLTREYNERVLGTADYLAPEQAVDSHRADSRADIYALGATMYFLFTGRPPFHEGSLPQRILAHQTQEPPPVSEVRPDVPEEIGDLLRAMMVKKRKDRIQTVDEIATWLQLWLAENEHRPEFDHRPGRTDLTCSGSSSATGDSSHGRLPNGSVRGRPPTDQPGVSDTRPIRERSPEFCPSTRESGIAGDAQDMQSASPYETEFETFLRRLDEQSGIAMVMTPDMLAARRRRLCDEFVAEADDFKDDDDVTCASPARLGPPDKEPNCVFAQPAEDSSAAVGRRVAVSRIRDQSFGLLLCSVGACLLTVLISIIVMRFDALRQLLGL